MAAESAPETEAERAELRLVVSLQDELDHLLDQFVRPGGYPQGTRLAVLLGDVDAPDWLPDPITVPQELADCLELLQAHPIDSLAVDPSGQGTIVLPDLGVCLDQEVFTTQVSIHPLQTEPSLSSIREDFDQLMDRLHSQHS